MSAQNAGVIRKSRWSACLGFLDRHFSFNSRRNIVNACIAVALLGGLLSLWLGQDVNWDLRNYHLYNGYAWLQGRITQDLAPAQMQSYFSPMLDVLHYLLMVRLPAPVAGFVMGALHGLLFVPVAGIVWFALRGQAHRARLVPLLALAGMCSGAFLSELGGSMADNTTALLVLGCVFLVLRALHGEGSALALKFGVLIVAGILLGGAVALKLTNAIYAIAIAVGMLAYPGPLSRRLLAVGVLALAALAAAGAIAGGWYVMVWKTFGNPLFPQFNAIFQGALAAPISVADTRWLPRNIGEQLIWPLIFTFNPKRVSEVSLVQCIWAFLYLGAILALALRLFRRDPAVPAFSPELRVVSVFFVTAYVLWQFAFSIQRYLVVLELLAPLLLWCLCQKLLPERRALRWGGRAVAFCALVSVLGWNTWGQERWQWRGFEVQAPPMAKPVESVVLLVDGDPQAWRIPFFPADARYVGVATGFPESSQYPQRVAQMLEERADHFAVISVPLNKAVGRVARMNVLMQRLGLTEGDGCPKLRWLAAKVRSLKSTVGEPSAGRCQLVSKSQELADPQQIAARERTTAQASLERYGLALDEASCVLLSSRIGEGQYPYLWCRVVPRAAQGSE